MIKRMIKKELDGVLAKWAREKGLSGVPQYSLEEPPKKIGGDLSTNAAMLLGKQLKVNPKAAAQELSGLIADSLKDVCEKVDIAGAGFINLTFSKRFLSGELSNILSQNESYGRSEDGGSEKMLFEFVSANPTGPLHIGHGRGAAIGDSLCRIFKHLGYDITREYYLNDVGNQMEMLVRSLKLRYEEVSGEKIEFPEDGYKGEYIKDIARKLLENKTPKDQIDFKKAALESMMATIASDLKGFGVAFDNWFSESVIALEKDASGRTKVDLACEYLLQEGLAEEKDGALWFLSMKYGDDKDRVLRRSDGRFTYLASDVAYHKNKLERGFTKLVDLWGADHHGYVPRMKAAMRALGKDPDSLVIILYQLVSLVRNGAPVAMSTRAGEFVTLEEVIREVGVDACRFFFMLRAPDSQLEFDLELAKKQSSENPVFYVQYVHARCCSIFKEYNSKNEGGAPAEPDLSLLNTPEERDLIKKLAFFPDTLELCAKNFTPHHLTGYLMECADLFHRFYENCRVIGDDKALTGARLTLVKGVASIIKNGLNLLGVSAPERM